MLESSVSVLRALTEAVLSQTGIRADKPEFIYIILLLPVFLAATVMAQGIGKMLHRDEDGGVIFFLGIVFFGLIAGVYAVFIR